MKQLKNVTSRKEPQRETHTMGFGNEMSIKFVQHKAGSSVSPILTESNELLQTEGLATITAENRKSG